MFHKVFVEQDIAKHQQTQKILGHLRPSQIQYIERYDDIWGRVKKPYLQKREQLNLFIAKKRGQLIKLAPQAYGTVNGTHYYFIHAFNCLYECEYCYLQGYFHSPDLVCFINHDDILAEVQRLLESTPKGKGPLWFHGGEFSDSLALSHITQELPLYFDFFYRHPNAYLELRTKSANIGALKPLSPSPNIIVSYSLSPQHHSQQLDRKTPSLKARLKAIEQLAQHGYQLAIHLDPIVDSPDLHYEYAQLLDSLAKALPWQQLAYLSLGVVRFTPSVYHQVQTNYPQSKILQQELIKSFDGKIRYSKPHRGKILNNIQKLCQQRGIPEEKIYLCME